VGDQHSNNSKKFKKYFVEKADEVMVRGTRIFKEAPRVLRFLHRKGIKLGVVSTKFRYRIETILRGENLMDPFGVIIGGEDVPKLKPDPFGLLLAVQKLKLSTSEVVYIGDSIVDAETASRANIHFIAILTGVTTHKEFDQFQVDSFIEKLSDLPKLMFK
jgi:phosphoglycolate phosphatase